MQFSCQIGFHVGRRETSGGQSHERRMHQLLPLQGGGREGDGVIWRLFRRSNPRSRPIPTPSRPIANVAFATFPLKGEGVGVHAIALRRRLHLASGPAIRVKIRADLQTPDASSAPFIPMKRWIPTLCQPAGSRPAITSLTSNQRDERTASSRRTFGPARTT